MRFGGKTSYHLVNRGPASECKLFNPLRSGWHIINVSLTHWGQDKMAVFSQTTLSNAFFFNENIRISTQNSLKFVPKGLINIIPALVLIMAWHWPGDKPLSEPMLVISLSSLGLNELNRIIICSGNVLSTPNKQQNKLLCFSQPSLQKQLCKCNRYRYVTRFVGNIKHLNLCTIKNNADDTTIVSSETNFYEVCCQNSRKICGENLSKNACKISATLFKSQWLNSLRPSDTYMHQYNIPTLVQIMACHMFGNKPLSELMLPYCQLDPKEHISLKFYFKFKSFHSRICIWKCLLWNGGHFVSASMC